MSPTHYLDLNLEIIDNKINHKLFDKRDAFGFSIVNFPDVSGNIPAKQSYGVFVSQLIRYARCCQHLQDFSERTKILIHRLTNQGFKKLILKKAFDKFVVDYYELLFKYNVPSSSLFCHVCYHEFCKRQNCFLGRNSIQKNKNIDCHTTHYPTYCHTMSNKKKKKQKTKKPRKKKNK